MKYIEAEIIGEKLKFASIFLNSFASYFDGEYWFADPIDGIKDDLEKYLPKEDILDIDKNKDIVKTINTKHDKRSKYKCYEEKPTLLIKIGNYLKSVWKLKKIEEKRGNNDDIITVENEPTKVLYNSNLVHYVVELY